MSLRDRIAMILRDYLRNGLSVEATADRIIAEIARSEGPPPTVEWSPDPFERDRHSRVLLGPPRPDPVYDDRETI